MDGVHDIGGLEGMGPIPKELESFHHEWEARVMAMRILMRGWRKWNMDGNRHSLERIPPSEYLRMSYYERWLASLVNQSVDFGLLTREEVSTGRPKADSIKLKPPVDKAAFLELLPKGRPTLRDIGVAPKFQLGDRVRTNRFGGAGHTRLPRYLRGCVGEIVRLHGAHVFPDVHYLAKDEAPQHLYSVRFSAIEVWGRGPSAKDSIFADMWESYLNPA